MFDAVWLRVAIFATAGLLFPACASIPSGRYGIDSVTIHGAEHMDARALEACLATHERESFGFDLGTDGTPECGVPPFDADHVRLSLWRWPWTDWPLFDRTVFDRDIDRVERWYRARGFYDAHVITSEVELDDDTHEADVTIALREGDPTRVSRIALTVDGPATAAQIAEWRRALELHEGDRFDESAYDRSKATLLREVRQASFARGRVEGRVVIDPSRRSADVTFHVTTGRPCRFGRVEVEGNGELPATAIVGAASIDRGDPFSQSVIEEAQRAVYSLQAFSSVVVEPILDPNRRDGSTTAGSAELPLNDPRPETIDVRITVVPGRIFRTGLGLGIQAGLLTSTLAAQVDEEVPQWDVHLLGIVEHRNFLGGLRRLRIEERPRLIINDSFPRFTTPQLGNRVTLELRQPAFIEPRTSLVTTAIYDVGPFPFEDFSRHSIDVAIGPRRTFFDGKLSLGVAAHETIFLPFDIGSSATDVEEYHNGFFEEWARLDLRDDPRAPRNGFYLSVNFQQSGYGLPSSWRYVRTTPEARVYVGLPLGMVVAAHFGVGVMHVFESSLSPGSNLAVLGPIDTRLRGGGATSNRGFEAGRLGTGTEGGLRRWEASLELRVRLTTDLGIVGFFDMGDVSREETFYFNRPNATAGFGIRYRTIVGPARLDVGFRLPGLQRFGDAPEPARESQTQTKIFFLQWPGALHITIGESF